MTQRARATRTAVAVAVLVAVGLAASATVVPGGVAAPAAADPTVVLVDVPGPSGRPGHPVAAPDGSVWFLVDREVTDGPGLVRLTPDGSVSELPLPNPDAGPTDLAVAPDGSLWIAELGDLDWPASGNRLARIAPDGTVTEYPLGAGSRPSDVEVAPDGTVWFLAHRPDRLGTLSPDGTVTDFPAPATYKVHDTWGVLPADGLALGPDGSAWVGLGSGGTGEGSLARRSSDGTWRRWRTWGEGVLALSVATDGTTWAVTRTSLVRIASGGTLREIPLPRSVTSRWPDSVAGVVGQRRAAWVSAGGDEHDRALVLRVSGCGTSTPVGFEAPAFSSVHVLPLGDRVYLSAARLAGWIDAATVTPAPCPARGDRVVVTWRWHGMRGRAGRSYTWPFLSNATGRVRLAVMRHGRAVTMTSGTMHPGRNRVVLRLAHRHRPLAPGAYRIALFAPDGRRYDTAALTIR